MSVPSSARLAVGDGAHWGAGRPERWRVDPKCGDALGASHEVAMHVTPTDSGDGALVVAMAAGDRQALARLYDRYGSLLLAVGLRVLGERREAEDVLHDVFLEAWRQASHYAPVRGTVRTWLVMRMRSRALDRRRSAGFSRSAPMDSLERRANPDAVDPAMAADHATLRAALFALPAEQRIVLELGYFEGLSSSEISEKEGIPLGTVKSRVAAALAKLRQGLTAEGGAR